MRFYFVYYDTDEGFGIVKAQSPEAAITRYHEHLKSNGVTDLDLDLFRAEDSNPEITILE